jgi:hypothetical protein
MSLSSIDDQVMLHQHPAELLQALLRFDITNPPGNEAACLAYLDRLLYPTSFGIGGGGGDSIADHTEVGIGT